MDTQEAVEIILPVTEFAVDPVSAPCNISEQKFETLAANPIATPTQEEINTEALAIAKRLMQQHSKTWKELGKY